MKEKIRQQREVKIGNIPVGSHVPPVFFAEIGSYFNGDQGLAKKMIEDVIEASKKIPNQPLVLKTEILDNPEICLKSDVQETYASKDGRIKKESYRELIERKVMPIDKYKDLFKVCVDNKVPFVVSVYDFFAADFAKDHGASSLKIASANVVHVPLIRHVAKLGLPMVIDTGRTTISEVFRAVNTAREAGCEDIIIQHSPDGHPASPKAHNLRIMQTYAQAFGLPVGLSDHYTGVEMLYASIALGASVLEKGVHVDPDELDQDISHTMDLADLPEVLQKTFDCWTALGSYERDKNAVIDGVIGTSQRQCLVAKKPLSKGDVINLDTVRFAFPCLGIAVENWDLVQGWVVDEEIPKDEPIRWKNVRP